MSDIDCGCGKDKEIDYLQHQLALARERLEKIANGHKPYKCTEFCWECAARATLAKLGEMK
jgi:hypothetical protein